MAFRRLRCAAVCAWGLGYGVIAPPFSATSTFGPGVNAWDSFRRFRASVGPALNASRLLMRPRLAAPECKIIGVGGLTAYRRLRFNDLIGNTLTLAIGHSVFLGVEAKGELLFHVAGTGPAH